MGLGTIGFAQAFARFCPDLLVVLGDRFEMHAAVVASLPFKIPVAHIHGGESTEGAIDEPIRHSITKMSHLHFPSMETYARRIIQMGEEPWRVVVTGSMSLDNLSALPMLDRRELSDRWGLEWNGPTLLVTYHPVTLEHEGIEAQLRGLLWALDQVDCSLIFTYPNSDPQGRIIVEMVRQFSERHTRTKFVTNLGTQAYFSLMEQVEAMVGNSSSGIIEAGSFKLPVVNIGNRQRGRVHGPNVIDVSQSQEEILAGIRKAVSPEFRASLAKMANPYYGNGNAAEIIIDKLKETEIDERLLMKRFYEVMATTKLEE